MNIHLFLLKKIYQAFIIVGIPTDSRAQLKQSTKVNFGDYQINGIIAIAKQLGVSSYELAKKVVSHLNLNGIANKIDVIKPGFINIFLDQHWIEKKITKILSSERLDIATVQSTVVVVDYSAPNIAKEMHVGHMRSTIIGDSIVRILEFLGHCVIRANHIGDWGTQFGMLIAYLEKLHNIGTEITNLSDLEKFYRSAKEFFDKNDDFAEQARSYVVKLQNGDFYCKNMWYKLVNITMEQNQKIYNRLNVTLTNSDVMGESIYNHMLPGIVDDLKKKGLAVKSNGAIVVYIDDIKSKNGNSMGVIIQKKDGAYLYATTDIACIKYRYEILKADRILYFTDSRQRQYLIQIWSIARKAGYIPESVSLEHHMFGMVLNKDGKPFKTRTGDTIKLSWFLDEGFKKARDVIINKNSNINADELERLSHIISIGAIKYADLSKNRITDYVFDWNNIFSFNGNTILYILYAYSRISSIIKNNSKITKQIAVNNICLSTKQERQLAVKLLQFEEIIIIVARDGTPHILCAYLYDLTVLFTLFYEFCPIVKFHIKHIRQSRLKLSLLTARTIKKGLELLGIETTERM